MSDIRNYERVKRRVKDLEEKQAQAEGSLKTHMGTLKEDFKCSTIAAGEKLLNKLESQEAKLKDAYESALEAFEEEYGDKL